MTEFKNIESSEKQLPAIIKDDEIDLVALMLHIWNGRVLILKTVAVFVVLGLFVALFGTVKYSSTVKLIPESTRGSSLGSLGGLASQFGLGNFSAAAEAGSIPTEFYPEIIYSIPFLQALMAYETHIPEKGAKMSLYEYLENRNKSSVSYFIKKYTIGLLAYLRGGEVGYDRESEQSNRMVVLLTKEEYGVIEDLKKRIGVSIGKNPGTINVTVSMPDPLLAADVANKVALLLSDYIIDYRTDKARVDLTFVEARLGEAKERFEVAQERLALFRDASHGRQTAMAQTEEQRLQSEYDLTFNVYNTLSRQLEEARLKVQEETPVVKIIEPALVPQEKSAPKRKMIMIISVFLGGFVGLGIVLGGMVAGKIKGQFLDYQR